MPKGVLERATSRDYSSLHLEGSAVLLCLLSEDFKHVEYVWDVSLGISVPYIHDDSSLLIQWCIIWEPWERHRSHCFPGWKVPRLKA